jgi:hypothetical protein
MNHYAYVLMMLDIARQQSASERRYLEARLAADMPASSGLRRLAARLVASVSRGSASIVRKLDDCVADELGRTLAPAE